MSVDLNLLILLSIAALNAFTAIVSWRTHDLSKQVEVNTNSMREQLVAATGKAAHAAGLEEGRLAGVQKADALAEGKRQGS